MSNGRLVELVGIAEPIVRYGDVGGIGQREVAACRVRAALVVSYRPTLRARIARGRGRRRSSRSGVIARLPVERFADAVLHRLAGSDEEIAGVAAGQHETEDCSRMESHYAAALLKSQEIPDPAAL